MLSVRALGLVVLALALHAPLALAQEGPSSLARADDAYARGALLEAGRAYEAALREPGHTQDELVRIHLRLGLTAIARRREREAQEHFRAALALDPSVSAPPELAPDARARFEAARPPPPAAPPEPVSPVEGPEPSEPGVESSSLVTPPVPEAQPDPEPVPSPSPPELVAIAPLAPVPEQTVAPRGPILTLADCLADRECADDSPRRCSLDPSCIVEPPARGPEWFEHPVFWGVAVGLVVLGAAAGTAGYLALNPPGFVLAAPVVR